MDLSCVHSSAISLHSGRLILGTFALIIISFYGGTLFGQRRITYSDSAQAGNQEMHDHLPNKITYTLRTDNLEIPVTGMNVCPLEYSEYIPCHDNRYTKTILKSLDHSRKEELERHCPPPKQLLFCLVPPPKGYKIPIKWPISRDFVWLNNVNHSKLAEVKGGQNWIHKNGSKWWFPGGGTHFKHGALEYIERLGNMTSHDQGDLMSSGVVQVLDAGCGVGSFGAYLLSLGIQTMSFAPRDEHENQVQFALERGILSFLSAVSKKRLPFPSGSFDLVHCSRCRIDWHENDGILLKEVDRILRPKGYFVYSAPPAYRKDKNFPEIWDKLIELTTAMCWELIGQRVQTAIWVKTGNQSCLLENANSLRSISLCNKEDDPDKAWNTPIPNCIFLSTGSKDIKQLPAQPDRLFATPEHLGALEANEAQFSADNAFWRKEVGEYWRLLKISSNSIHNIIDMNAYYGGFAAALTGKPLWVMNVVPAGLKDTLPIIYDRGLLGVYHNWCESFSTYPRTYDLIHAFRVFSSYKNGGKGCHMVDIMLEMDRMLRPMGFVVIRDSSSVVEAAANLAPKFLWNTSIHDIYVDGELQLKERLLICRKKFWTIV